LTTHHLQRELDVALALAQQAGQAIMRFYRGKLEVERKAGDEPVTAADRIADELIAAGLRSAFPGDGLLTEESDDDLSRLEKERVWIVDPLDGTTEFIDETDDFAVQIALTVGGHPVLGVVHPPVSGQIYYAASGQGAYGIGPGGRRRLHVTAVADPAEMCLVASRSHYSSFIEAARRALGIASVDQMGSVGLKVSRVAEGTCDLYLAATVSQEWDLCAPHALLLEAGGMLTNLCGEPVVYNRENPAACRGLVVSNGRIHGRIVESLTPLLGLVGG